MTLLTEQQISMMRYMYKRAMPDKCTIQTRSNVVDDYGQPVASWSNAYTGVDCGFEFSPFKFRSREIVAGGEEVSEILVRARLPLTYYDEITQSDRLVLTHRNGEEYSSPETYEIQGFPERGQVGIVVNLKRVTP